MNLFWYVFDKVVAFSFLQICQKKTIKHNVYQYIYFQYKDSLNYEEHLNTIAHLSGRSHFRAK